MALTVVGIGGSLRAESQSERALRAVLKAVEAAGAETIEISGSGLRLPFYDPSLEERTPEARTLVDAVREADGIVLVSPGYHGTVSGLFKNALDYLEDLRDDTQPYFHGRAVGCVATSYGWQAAVTTLTALRSIVHALRGWPTPLGAAVNSMESRFDEHGTCSTENVANNLRIIGEQVVQFASESRVPANT